MLLHGFATSADADWLAGRWAVPLAAAGRASLAVRLPGHAGGPPVSSPTDGTTSALVARLAQTVAASGAAEVDIVGYSLGARLAWDLVAAVDVPVRRLVLGGLSPIEPFTAVDLGAARAAATGGPAPDDLITGMITAMATAPGQDATSLLNLVEGLAREPFDPAAGPPSVPTLLIVGSEDPMAQGIDQVAGLIDDARVQRVAGDHLSTLASDAFRAAVFAFLGASQ